MDELRVQGLAVSYSPAGHTALVALHGAGNGTRDSHPLYRHLHETLPPLGVGVATFDRRGDGESEGRPTLGRFEAQVRDGLAVAAALETERFGLWGFSQGGWVAPLAATLSDDVAFVITIAALGLTAADLLLHANRRQLELAGDYEPKVIKQAAALRRRMPYDPRAVFAAVRVPILAFYGELDSMTPAEPSVTAWPPHAMVVVVPDAGHGLHLSDGTLAPLYEHTLVDWLS
ncbi:MAG TPA: alpha/beta fold hydrolase [Gaiellaceae bacterium]|nr:alpha/beta fold hydrolase [Gaiellaceae bacterium]